MKLLIKTFAVFVLCLCFSPLHAEPALNEGKAEQFIKDVEQMRHVYLKAVNGDKRDVRAAVKQSDALARQYPTHPLVIVYKGCALAQRGRDISARPMNRMRDTEQGLNYIDRGLRMLKPDEHHFLEIAEAHLLSAFLFVHLPDSVFHRLKQGKHLVETLLQHERFAEMPVGMQAGIYMAAAVSAEKHNLVAEQRRYLELSLKTNPEGDNAQEARTMLDALAD